MRAIVQRVSRAEVRIGPEVVGRIDQGLLVYAGVGADDSEQDVEYLLDKIRHVRIFADENGKMNLDVFQVGGGILLISNFTLLADARKGRRPDFAAAADPDAANGLYELLCKKLGDTGVRVEKGRFGALMSVDAVNDGPINILVDSKRQF